MYTQEFIFHATRVDFLDKKILLKLWKAADKPNKILISQRFDLPEEINLEIFKDDELTLSWSSKQYRSSEEIDRVLRNSDNLQVWRNLSGSKNLSNFGVKFLLTKDDLQIVENILSMDRIKGEEKNTALRKYIELLNIDLEKNDDYFYQNSYGEVFLDRIGRSSQDFINVLEGSNLRTIGLITNGSSYAWENPILEELIIDRLLQINEREDILAHPGAIREYIMAAENLLKCKGDKRYRYEELKEVLILPLEIRNAFASRVSRPLENFLEELVLNCKINCKKEYHLEMITDFDAHYSTVDELLPYILRARLIHNIESELLNPRFYRNRISYDAKVILGEEFAYQREGIKVMKALYYLYGAKSFPGARYHDEILLELAKDGVILADTKYSKKILNNVLEEFKPLKNALNEKLLMKEFLEKIDKLDDSERDIILKLFQEWEGNFGELKALAKRL